MPDTHSLDYVLKSGVAGGLAGCAAKTLIAPMDRVKILFQTGNPEFKRWAGTFVGLPKAISYIYRTEGALGLFRGHSATLVRIFPYAAIKFVAYEQIRAVIIPSKQKETHFRRFASGSLAGMLSVLCTYPLDVIRVQLAYTGSDPKLKTEKHRLLRTCRDLWTSGSSNSTFWRKIRNLYPGFGATLMGIVPYAGVSFFAHDLGHDIFHSKYLESIAVKKSAQKNFNDTNDLTSSSRRPPLKAWAQIIAGGMSGVIAQTVSYPLEVVRRRMQVSKITQKNAEPGKVVKNTFLNTTRAVYKECGLRGFFVGLSIGYLKIGPMFACSFYVYERTKHYFEL